MIAADLLTIVLAAGKGTRMRSSRPKVLHEIAGQSMLGHVLRSTTAVGGSASRTAVVVGPEMERVALEARRIRADAELFVQEQQRGTADAVLAARGALQGHNGDVLVVYGDTPLLTSTTLRALLGRLDAGAHVAVLGFEARDPTGYGRLLVDTKGQLNGIREEQDATTEERSVRLCNSGVMAFRCSDLVGLLDRITCANAKGEYYLTDVVGIAREQGLAAVVAVCPEDEVMGVNSRDQLAVAEGIFQRRARIEAMAGGVTMVAPETVWLAYDTRLGRDVKIEPDVVFGPGVEIADNVEILAFSHIAGAKIEAGAQIGPYARIRPGSTVGPQAHVGNFVELKNTRMEDGAKVNHLSYVGDGRIGREANIGAGTIFCNYDGFNKHRTDVGAGAFVGSNSALVAPVSIGERAYVGSGSVITRDVPADALGLERAEMQVREGWAAKFRTIMGRRRPKTG